MLIPDKHSGYQSGGRLYPGGGKGGSSAPPPDPALIAANIRSMGIQDTAITKMMANADAMMPLQMEQMQFGLDSSRTAYDQSQADREWMLDRRGNLSGLQDTLLSDAKDFNTDARREQLAGQANADVTSAFNNVQGQQQRGLSRMGVNPSSGRSLAMNNQTGIAQASATASAMNKTREAARLEGYSLTDRATNALSGYPAMSSAATGAGASYGGMGLSTANAGLAGMNSGYGAGSTAAGQMGSNAANMYGAMGSYKNGQDQIAASNDPFNTILGAAAGGLASTVKWSDRRLKTNIKRIATRPDGVSIYTFDYIFGGGRQVGVMADEVAVSNPDAVVVMPNGFLAVDYAKI